MNTKIAILSDAGMHVKLDPQLKRAVQMSLLLIHFQTCKDDGCSQVLNWFGLEVEPEETD